MSIKEALAMPDKRMVDRIPARVLVRVFQENRAVLREYSVNMSAGGIFLESNNLLPEDTPLVLHFELPDSRHIHCNARVAWRNDPRCFVCDGMPSGMGIQFIDLRPEDMEALRDFVKKELIYPRW